MKPSSTTLSLHLLPSYSLQSFPSQAGSSTYNLKSQSSLYTQQSKVKGKEALRAGTATGIKNLLKNSLAPLICLFSLIFHLHHQKHKRHRATTLTPVPLQIHFTATLSTLQNIHLHSHSNVHHRPYWIIPH